jgi:hypothetical protein
MTPSDANRAIGQRTALPYGGDVAVARSMVAVHVRNPWTGRCRGCRDPYPCRERRAAEQVLERRQQRWLAFLLLPIAVALLLTAAAGAGVIRW